MDKCFLFTVRKRPSRTVDKWLPRYRWLLLAVKRLEKKWLPSVLKEIYPKSVLRNTMPGRIPNTQPTYNFPYKISLYHKWISYCKNILLIDIGKCSSTHSIWIKYIYWFWFQKKKHSCSYETNHYSYIYTTWKLIRIAIVWHRYNSLLNKRESLILVPV